MKKEAAQERQFGIVFLLFILLIILYQFFFKNYYSIWLISVECILLLITIYFPKFLKIPSNLWLKFGELIGKITTPIIIALIFFLVVLPTSIILKIFKKDLLDQNIDKNANSYWKLREEKYTNFDKQF